MSRFFTVRNTLVAITGLGTAIIFWLMADQWIEASTQRNDALRVLQSTEAGDLLIEFEHELMYERVNAYVVLSHTGVTDESIQNEFQGYRDRADLAMNKLVAHAQSNTTDVFLQDSFEKLQSEYSMHVALRQKVDREMALPASSRDPGLREIWFTQVSGLISLTRGTRQSTTYQARAAVRNIEALQSLLEDVRIMEEYAERERVIIAGSVAIGDVLVLSDIENLSTYRGHLEQAWGAVEQYLELPNPDPDTITAINIVKQLYFDTFEQIRRPIIQAGIKAQNYPVDSELWLEQSSNAIGPIHQLEIIVYRTLKNLALEREKQGVRKLFLVTGLLVATLAMAAVSLWIVFSWIARPLSQIGQSMLLLSKGERDIDIPYTHLRTEIGDMARAVSMFKKSADMKANSINTAASKLRELNKELEARVHERTLEFEEARDEAVAANQTKSLFLANMSHELRTPLNAIIGYSEILLEEADEDGLTAYSDDLFKIKTAGKNLLSQINHVLDISKIEAGKMELYLESIDIRRMVNDVMTTITPLAESNSSELVIECDDGIGTMLGDLTKVRQCLLNLMSNACKFTSNGTVTLSVHRQESSKGDQIIFKVIDTGIGISEEHANRIFDAFSQADSSTTRLYGGTGLGLAITHSFCQMVNGDISVTSEPEKGSIFTMRLPAVLETEDSPHGQADSIIDLTQNIREENSAGTVLVVDDDSAVRDIIKRRLVKDGYHVHTAKSGAECLEVASRFHPDVITLDVLMPRMDGWTVLARLKADPELADIPVIMVSIVDDRNLGFSLGVEDYLTKPVDREKLVSVIKKYCEKIPYGQALVVEDDVHSRMLMGRVLRAEKWNVIEAENGKLAIDKMAETKPDLILLDLMMPVMDGFDFVEHIRAVQEWKDIPVIVVTAMSLTHSDHNRLNGRIRLLVEKGQDMESVLGEVVNSLPSKRIEELSEA